MVHAFVDIIVGFLQSTRMSNWLITMIVSFLPIAELRLGIPIGMRLGLSSTQSWIFAFIGSSMAAPVVILCFMPILKKMMASKSFSKIGDFFTNFFDSHAKKLENPKDNNKKKTPFKRMLAVTIFVALPGPLTGVWGGAAVANLLKLSFWKSVISVIIGNLIASLLVLAFSDLFEVFLDYIIVLMLVLAAFSILALIYKIVKKCFFNRKEKANVQI